MTLPLPGGGGECVGSGKFGTPCLRMHFARANIASSRLSDDDPGPLPPDPRLAHAFWADRNAGACGLMSLGIRRPRPFAPGSGKFGTPCERMHSASLSNGP